MPALDRLMKKLGYVKLSAFGLVLTPEGRVLSMRPAVLDDGLGGKIVGWQDGDLAAAELERYGAPRPVQAAQPTRPAPKAAVATRVAPPIPQVVVRETSAPVNVAPIPTLIKPAAPAPAPVKVAPQPPAEEDDWEWTIAIARARAAAEDAEAAAISASSAAKKATAAVPPKKFVPATTQVAAKTLPIAKVAAEAAPAPGMDTDNWPKTEPLHTLDPDDFQQEVATEVVRVVKAVHTPRVVLPAKPTPPQPMPVVAPPQAAHTSAPKVIVTPPASAQRAFERGKSPATVIPVPKLPSIAKTPIASAVAPVVKAPVTPVTPIRARLAKGTGPYLPKTGEVPTLVQPEPPPLQPGGEDTVPHLILPPVARASRA